MSVWVLLTVTLGCGGDPLASTVVAARRESGTMAPLPAPPQCPGDATLPDDRVIATWNGGQLTYADLRGQIDGDLQRMEIQHRIARYELESRALDSLLVERLLSEEAHRLGYPDVDTLLVNELERNVPAPSDQEVADFYPVVARQLGGASLDESTPFLRQELMRRAQEDAFVGYVDGLKRKAGAQSDLPYPDLPRVDVMISPDDPVRGATDAKVTIVQFAEYQCFYCNKMQPTLEQILHDYDGRVKLVFKDFPLAGHERAMPAAIAAHCAGEQSHFWELSHVLLEHQQALGDSDLARYAGDLGLDVDKFTECLDSGRYDAAIQADIEEGRGDGVSATPTFFVNGVFLSGSQTYERLQAVIDRELRR